MKRKRLSFEAEIGSNIVGMYRNGGKKERSYLNNQATEKTSEKTITEKMANTKLQYLYSITET